MNAIRPLPICETCPWLTKNHGKKHPAGWYKKSNLRRLWTGLRTGEAPGMICHSTDPNSAEYGGKEGIKAGHERPCAGALTLIYQCINAISEGKPQPHSPPMTKPAMADFVWRQLTGNMPALDNRIDEVSLPWK